MERFSGLLDLGRVQSILGGERCRTHGGLLFQACSRVLHIGNQPETPHEKSIFSPTAWFCYARCALRMARRKKLPSAGCCCLGHPVHSLLAATRNGLVGVIADELRPRVGGGAFQHSFRTCPGSPQSRTPSCYPGSQRLWSRCRAAVEPHGRVRVYRLPGIDVARVNQLPYGVCQMPGAPPLAAHNFFKKLD